MSSSWGQMMLMEVVLADVSDLELGAVLELTM
jgi:hypothetical protein